MLDMSPWVLFSGLFIGLVGMAMIVYGKKAEDPASIFGGIALSAIPLLAHSVLVLWLLAVAGFAGTIGLRRVFEL
ncbi:MAG: hypothetical protein R3B49_02145 [Phycisphaerales bacterium]